MAVRILPFPHLNRGKKGNIVQGDTVKIERKGIFLCMMKNCSLAVEMF